MTLPFPVAALNQHTLLLGKTRSGKSSKMRLFVEHFLNKKTPVTLVDPKGDWWGLKSSADGKKAGYPIIIFGSEWAKFADVRINKHSGAEIGKLVATGNRSCIIDLKGMTVADRTQFFIDFADAYFRHAEGKRVLAIDEVHNFAPQGKVIDPKAGMALHWANRLISEGGGMGITMLSASQRPQKVHKDYATSHETLIACRAVHKLDREASGDWVDACGDPSVKRDLLGSLAGMKREEAWVYSPEIEFGPKRLTFPMFSTYDSFAPQESKTARKLRGWAEVDLGEVEEKIASLVEENKQNDPKALKAEIAKLRADATKTAKNIPQNIPVSDPKALHAAYQRGVADAFAAVAPGFKSAIEGLSERVRKSFVDIRLTFPKVPTPKDIQKSSGSPASVPALTDPAKHAAPSRSVVSPSLSGKAAAAAGSSDGTFTGPQMKVLRSLAMWKTLGHDQPSKEMVGAVAGYRPTSGGYANLLSGLRVMDAVNYPTPGRVELKVSGIDEPTLGQGRDQLLSILSAPQRKVVDAALALGATTKQAIAEHSGYQPTSGGFANLLSSVRTLGIIDYPQPGHIALSDWARELFDGGAI